MADTRPEKSIIVAYVLWLFFGQFAMHRFYLRRFKSGFAFIGLLISGIMTLILLGVLEGSASEASMTVFAFLGLGSLLAWLLWYVADIVLIPIMINRDREEAKLADPKNVTEVFE